MPLAYGWSSWSAARRAPLIGWLAYTLSRSLRAFEGGVVGPSDWD